MLREEMWRWHETAAVCVTSITVSHRWQQEVPVTSTHFRIRVNLKCTTCNFRDKTSAWRFSDTHWCLPLTIMSDSWRSASNTWRCTPPTPITVNTPRRQSMLSIIKQSALRQAHSLFQSQFSTECDLVLPLSISSIFSCPQDHPIAAYAFFLVFLSLP
jgi:hypothetical protein